MPDPETCSQENVGDRIGQDIEISHVKAPDRRASEGRNYVQDDGGLLPRMTNEYSGWDVYNNEAKKVDTELVKDWTASLNSLLLFAAIFAAVLTAFIIESKKMLEQNSTDVMVDVMIFYTNSVANGTHLPYIQSHFKPDSWAISVNCLFFVSLSVSLVAALASVISLQWVADYDAAITRGGSSPEDRAKRRHFRHAGVVRWKMAEVIATLPMLLYFSVILFFSGLILWMWAVEQTVGLVVTGGAAIAVIFYSASTLLAVAFVSAPFRTPLSRWIYSLIHVPFSLGYLVARSLRFQSVSAWLETRHEVYSSSHKREDLEVEKRGKLGMNALVWLANQLSISQDSYERLFLLASELPKLDLKHIACQEFGEAPWFSIFDLLGWKHLKENPNESINTEHMRAMGMLIRCGRVRGISDIVLPTETAPYITNMACEGYWTQYCDTERGHWSRNQASHKPNALFLLLRDAPLLPSYSPDEMKAVLQFSRWRNSSEKDPKDWNRIIALAVDSSPRIVDAFTRTLSQFLIAQGPEWHTRNESLLIGIFDRILRYLIDGKVTVSAITMDLMARAFERVITWKETKSTDSYISRPRFYRQMLGYSSMEARSAHCLLALLLARNLSSYSGVEMARRINTITVMLWLQPTRPPMEAPVAMKSIAFQYWSPTTDLNAPNSKEAAQWIANADKNPHINAILSHLATAQAELPEIGPLWRSSTSDETNIHLCEALQTFDRMIHRGVTAVQHHTLISLLCQDLELGPPDTFTNYFARYGLQSLEELRDPCLRLLAKSITAPVVERLYLPFAHPSGLLTPSWVRVGKHLMEYHAKTNSPSMLRLKASVWPAIANHRTGLCDLAPGDPDALALLQLVFEYPISCSQHYDGEGRLLLHVFQHVGSCKFSVNMMGLTTIPMYGRIFDVLLIILALPDQYQGQLRSEELDEILDERCLIKVLEICAVVKASQFSFLSLICDLVVRANINGLAAEDVELVSICIENALRLPRDDRVSLIIPVLTLRFGRLRDRMLERAFRDSEENEVASSRATRCIRALMDLLAAIMVFGGRNYRIISCARTVDGHSPAVGWSPVHVY